MECSFAQASPFLPAFFSANKCDQVVTSAQEPPVIGAICARGLCKLHRWHLGACAESLYGLCHDLLGTLCTSQNCSPSDLTGLSWIQKLWRHLVMANMTGEPFSILETMKDSHSTASTSNMHLPHFPPPSKLKPRQESYTAEWEVCSSSCVLSLPTQQMHGRIQKAAET